MIAHYISNVIEDGYIENRVLNNFPGTLGYGLEKLRERHFEQILTVTQLIEQEDEESHIFESILQIMLSYAKFGEIKYGDEPLSDERIQAVFGLITDIDSALMSRSGKDRLNVVNMVLVRCWDYIESFCEECKKRQEEAITSGGSASLAETLSEVLGAIAGGSEIGEGSSTPVPEASDGSEESATAGKRAQTHADAESEDDSRETEGFQTDSETEEKPSGSGGSNNSSDKETAPIDGGSSGAEKQETADTEQGRIPYHQSESLSEPVGGSIERNDDYEREQYDRAASDIERLLDKMAEKRSASNWRMKGFRS